MRMSDGHGLSLFLDRRFVRLLPHRPLRDVSERNHRFSPIEFVTMTEKRLFERVAKGAGHETIEKEIDRIVNQR